MPRRYCLVSGSSALPSVARLRVSFASIVDDRPLTDCDARSVDPPNCFSIWSMRSGRTFFETSCPLDAISPSADVDTPIASASIFCAGMPASANWFSSSWLTLPFSSIWLNASDARPNVSALSPLMSESPVITRVRSSAATPAPSSRCADCMTDASSNGDQSANSCNFLKVASAFAASPVRRRSVFRYPSTSEAAATLALTTAMVPATSAAVAATATPIPMAAMLAPPPTDVNARAAPSAPPDVPDIPELSPFSAPLMRFSAGVA